MTMTLSPVSMCGVKIGLCLPRMILATSAARRPRTMPSASTMNHCCSMSLGVAENVFIAWPNETKWVLRLTGAGCNPGLGSHQRHFLTDSQAIQALMDCQLTAYRPLLCHPSGAMSSRALRRLRSSRAGCARDLQFDSHEDRMTS